MLGVIIVNWLLGQGVCRWGRCVLWGGVALDVGLLAACRLIPLPLPGASYLMFSLISYLADLERGEVQPASPLYFGAYAGMFPRLIAGPIARAREMIPQLERPGAASGGWRRGPVW